MIHPEKQTEWFKLVLKVDTIDEFDDKNKILTRGVMK